MSKTDNSYGQILKSSSIIGGAQGLNILVSMIRIKAVAIFLGPAGVGLVGMYTTITGFVSMFAGMGISNSAVRDIAEADGSGDEKRIACSIKALRRTCWVTGLLGWALTAALSWPLSVWAFGSEKHAWALCIIGVTVMFNEISGGQTALLQGKRRIGDLARLNVFSVIVSSILSVGLYAWLRERGVIPVIVLCGTVSLLSSWWFARKVKCPELKIRWTESWPDAKRMMGLGLAFMWSGILAGGTVFITRTLILRQFGMDANGFYQAAWSISGMFAGYIIGAMGTDFYPRLTAAAHDHPQVNRLVNEQVEIGILLSLPGLVGSLAFAPLMMHVFYSAKFLQSAELLPWFILGVFGQVITWPLGFITLAKGEARLFAITQTIAPFLQVALVLSCMKLLGLWGAALGYALLYAIYGVMVYYIGRHLTGFRWSSSALRLLISSGLIILVSFAAQKWAPGISGYICGGILTLITGIFSLRSMASLLGAEHRLVRLACKLPGGEILCGIKS